MIPGPGAYTITQITNSAPSYSLSGRTAISKESHVESPGPGA
jgi:hypothetical protein